MKKIFSAETKKKKTQTTLLSNEYWENLVGNTLKFEQTGKEEAKCNNYETMRRRKI